MKKRVLNRLSPSDTHETPKKALVAKFPETVIDVTYMPKKRKETKRKQEPVIIRRIKRNTAYPSKLHPGNSVHGHPSNTQASKSPNGSINKDGRSSTYLAKKFINRN
jgi:hypothetical protein